MNPLNDKDGDFQFDDLLEGVSFRHEYSVTGSLYRQFLDLFGDRSPLHVEDSVAVSCGFAARLMHGALLNGFISNFVGMHFPGKRTLELGVDIQFVQPFFEDDRLVLEAEVKERLAVRKVVLLHFRFSRGDATIARGRIRAMICDL